VYALRRDTKTTMRRTRRGLYLALGMALLLGLLLAGRGIALVQTAETPTAEEPAPGSPEEAPPALEATLIPGDVVETRTPMPTATPGWLERRVNQATDEAGLSQTRILGLDAADWINLGLSLLLVAVAYLLGTWLIRGLLPSFVQRTPTGFDDLLLKETGASLRWLVVTFVLRYATLRLTFVKADVKVILADVYYVLSLFLLWAIIWRLIGLADRWYRQRFAEAGREEELGPLVTLLARIGRVVVGVVGVAVLLSHFGINVVAFSTALGLGGLAISLAARDTIADAIAGLIILVDQPFRIGDRIEIQEEGTWGDVVDIGLRATRIRTRDNRMVIVPNSVIGANQVINYTYPDPRYRIQTHVGIACGTDIERARQVIIDAVRRVEGVLPDRPVEALYSEMGDSAMIFRVRWWIESYADTRQVTDRVHSALQRALDKAGIECPFPTQNVHLSLGPEMAEPPPSRHIG